MVLLFRSHFLRPHSILTSNFRSQFYFYVISIVIRFSCRPWTYAIQICSIYSELEFTIFACCFFFCPPAPHINLFEAFSENKSICSSLYYFFSTFFFALFLSFRPYNWIYLNGIICTTHKYERILFQWHKMVLHKSIAITSMQCTIIANGICMWTTAIHTESQRQWQEMR